MFNPRPLMPLARIPTLPLLVVVLVAALAPIARGDNAAPALAESERFMLGARFESEAAGLSFYGPADCRELRRSGSDQLVQYVNDNRKWSLTVTRAVLSRPMRLVSHPDEKDPTRSVAGMLDTVLGQMRTDQPGIEIFRQDVINVGELEVGMIAARSTVQLETLLTQRALVRANDRLYYSFSFVTPAPRQGPVEDDREVQKVVDLFNRIIDSVRVIDQSRIVEEQNQRLFRTRTAMLGFSESAIREAIVPEQWWRLIRDGKDIGYSYVVEEVANDLPRRGVLGGEGNLASGRGVRIGIRSRTYPEKGVQVDTESWFFVSFDRKNEIWSNVGLITKPDGTKEDFGEFGSADREVRRVVDRNLAPGEVLPGGKVDENQPPVRQTEVYMLTVARNTSKLRGQATERQLPPFYLPQALNHLLPRILPLREPKTYLFASWVSEQGEVMKRYIDVGAETSVQLADRRVRAIPVGDRVGIEGSVTTHYVSPEGRYLGSVNHDSKITILAADKAALEQIWSNPNLTRPGEVKDN